MKLAFRFFVLFCAIVTGCTHTTGPNSDSNQYSAHIDSIAGQIDNWGHTDLWYISLTYRDSLMNIGISSTSSIDPNGQFSLNSLNPPPPHSPGTVPYPTENDLVEFLENNLTCSDSSAILVPGQLLVCPHRPNDVIPNDWLGNVWKATYTSLSPRQPGDHDVAYLYATKDVDLSGTLKVATRNGDREFRQIFHYGLHYALGWNQCVHSFIAARTYVDSNMTIDEAEYSLSSIELSPGKWIYSGE